MYLKIATDRSFLRHYGEMVLVMALGMVVLGLPTGWMLEGIGSSWSELRADAPAAMLGLMALTMTAPMVWWMRRRGHGARATAEMAASMIVPTLAAIALLTVAEIGDLLVAEHVLMLAGMFAVMLARPEEYTHGRHHHDPLEA